MVLERKRPFVLQPLHAVIRLEQIRPVEHVAVGKQHVGVAVAVEIDDLDAAGAKRRMRGGEDRLRPERTIALVQIRNDRFMFLADQCHKIGPLVAIQIDNRHVNRPMSAHPLSCASKLAAATSRSFGSPNTESRPSSAIQTPPRPNPACRRR